MYQHKVIESLDTDNSDEKELKTKLLMKLKNKPNPIERDCDEFIREIREYEAVTNSRGHKEEKNIIIKKVDKPEDKKDDPPKAPHALCGVVHERRQCKYRCDGCGKPHPEQDCFFLHPEKRPKGWKTPDRKRNGRNRDRGGRERKRSQTRSNERKDSRSDDRRGEPSKSGKRDKSPPKIRTLRSEDEDDSSQERRNLESRLEKLKEKKTR